jgi:hypothetical protein
MGNIGIMKRCKNDAVRYSSRPAQWPATLMVQAIHPGIAVSLKPKLGNHGKRATMVLTYLEFATCKNMARLRNESLRQGIITARFPEPG